MATHSPSMWLTASDRSRVLAVLGPTNTGKTHFAVERMLAHASGMMGFPLRLLAREIYDRIVVLRGEPAVALITGEEKRIPAGARYFVCTTEAMPAGRPVAFLAVDEIQLCADPERGHVFTDRLLRARGEQETMFLGSETIRPLIRRLVPEAEIVTRPRFSTLAHAGQTKLTRMPRRSAVVAFRTSDVYRLAEILRRHKGGAAVVLGALSPRTRNAQVAMYQAGEVEHMVATDAIGMGLNMDLAHVAFAATEKFDGREVRALQPRELAQIAGRAGRHMRDGTFGTTSDVAELDGRMVEAVETHSFAPLRAIWWRNGDLDFSSLAGLRATLDRPAPAPGLLRKRDAIDDLALRSLASRAEVRERAATSDEVRLLWDVCQIPDFTKTLAEHHVALLARIFDALSRDGRLPTDWVADRIARLERVDGDLDTLTARLAHVRIWSYVAHRENWLDDAAHWQARAQEVEDRLSDALHDRLTQRFVDRRTSALLRSLRERDTLPAAVTRAGVVVIDGHEVGHVAGLEFVADREAESEDRRVIDAAARRVLGPEISRRAGELVRATDDAFTLDDGLLVRWAGEPVARLQRGATPLRPRVAVLDFAHLQGRGRSAVAGRLTRWLDARVAAALGPLLRLEAAALRGPGRGIAYRLVEGLGTVPTDAVADLIGALDATDRAALTRFGVRFGVHHVFLPALLRPAAVTARARLWRLHRRGHGVEPPPAGRVTLVRRAESAAEDYAAIGFGAFAAHAVRVDMLERFGARLRALCRTDGGFAADGPLAASVGLSPDALAELVAELGYRSRSADDADARFFVPSRRLPVRRRQAERSTAAADSPFAVLKELCQSA